MTVWLVAQQIVTPPLRLCRVAPTVHFVPRGFPGGRCDLSRGLPPTCWAHSLLRAGPGLTGPALQAPAGTQHSLPATAPGRAARGPSVPQPDRTGLLTAGVMTSACGWGTLLWGALLRGVTVVVADQTPYVGGFYFGRERGNVGGNLPSVYQIPIDLIDS